MFANWVLKFALLGGFLFWTALTLFFDAIVARDIVLQIRAQRFSRVVGRLVRSDVKYCDDGSDSSSIWNYEPDVAYSYVVDGIRHRGTRYRYSGQSSTRRFSEAAARSFLPQGPEVDVFYNPRDPADAVLSPGLHGPDLFAALFLAPFNAVVAIGVIACFQYSRYRETRGIPVWDDGRIARAGVHRWNPAIAAIAAAAAAAFVLVFAVGVPTGGHPTIGVASGAWLIVLCVAGFTWRASARAVTNGARDLIVDREKQTLTLPAFRGQKDRLTIPWHTLSGVEVEAGRDDAGTAHYAAVAILARADGTTSRERLADSQSEPMALAVAAWLRRLMSAD